MATVVITGVAGFLGSHIADEFLDRGWQVRGIDNMIGGDYDNIPDGVRFFELDLCDLSAIEPVFDGADLVVHTACTAYEGLSVFSPSLVTDNTVMATVNSVTAAIKGGVKRFIHMSSMARYGDHGGKLFDETDEPRPQDPYGISKLAAEQLLRNLCDVHNVEWVILVPHNIIGPRQKYDDPFRNVASIMTNRMLQGQQPIIYGTGEQQRCFSFIEDVINPLMVAFESDEAVGQVINIGPDEEHVTINHLARELADIIGFDLDPIYKTGRPQEVPIALCSSNKARDLLGYETQTSLRSGLEQLVAYIKERGTKPFAYHLPLEIINEKTPETWTRKLI